MGIVSEGRRRKGTRGVKVEKCGKGKQGSNRVVCVCRVLGKRKGLCDKGIVKGKKNGKDKIKRQGLGYREGIRKWELHENGCGLREEKWKEMEGGRD